MSNTSPIYNLAAIDRLELLREEFRQVLIPEAVHDELRKIRGRPEWRAIGQALDEDWISIRSIREGKTHRVLTLDLDAGEAEAISLALEIDAPFVLIDESDGRAMAVHLGLRPIGVLGVLLKAKQRGQLASVREAMYSLRERAGFFIQAELFEEVIRLAGE